jgi:hypothetical protein
MPLPRRTGYEDRVADCSNAERREERRGEENRGEVGMATMI